MFTMKTKTRRVLFAALIPFLGIGAGGCGSSSSSPAEPTLPADVEALRASLAPYSSLALAKTAGYSTAITDCMSNGDEGAMGVHFGNNAFIDGTADALHPEALIYEPGTNGEMSLVGVEFLVPFTAVPKTAAAPVLFGQKFQVNDVFGVWALHVWTHRSNPSGLFANWNPRVHC
jgi:hypothetical protein